MGNSIDIHELILHLVEVCVTGVAILIGKIIWDWLSRRKQEEENGHQDAMLERLEISQTKVETILIRMDDRQAKMWEHMLGEGR